MTEAQALKRVRKKYGKLARVRISTCRKLTESERKARWTCNGTSHKAGCEGGITTYTVLDLVGGMFSVIRGSGASWEEALAEAQVP